MDHTLPNFVLYLALFGLRIMNTKFGQNWPRRFRVDDKFMTDRQIAITIKLTCDPTAQVR